MYQLVSRINNALTELRNLLESHITQQGLDAISKCDDTAVNVNIFNIIMIMRDKFTFFIFQDPKIYVQTILDVHKKYNALVMTAFRNDAGFVAALDKVCFHIFVIISAKLSHNYLGLRKIYKFKRNYQKSRSFYQESRVIG